MNKLIAGMLFLIAPSAFGCVYSVEATDTYAKVCYAADSCREVVYQTLPNMSQSRKNDLMRTAMQTYIDVRLPLDEFPPEDPDKATDPNCENFFWGLSDGTPTSDPLIATHLIARPCVVEPVTYNGTQYHFTFRRASRCP